MICLKRALEPDLAISNKAGARVSVIDYRNKNVGGRRQALSAGSVLQASFQKSCQNYQCNLSLGNDGRALALLSNRLLTEPILKLSTLFFPGGVVNIVPTLPSALSWSGVTIQYRSGVIVAVDALADDRTLLPTQGCKLGHTIHAKRRVSPSEACKRRFEQVISSHVV
jgi:hypothetical protein